MEAKIAVGIPTVDVAVVSPGAFTERASGTGVPRVAAHDERRGRAREEDAAPAAQ